MEVTLEKKNNVTASITVRLDEADYSDNVNKTLKDYAKKANMKGFRPGKVPVGLMKKMYGKSVLVQEVSELSQEALKNYIKEEDLKLVAQPIFDGEAAPEIDWDTQKEFTFAYEVGLEPEIDYEPLLANLDLTKREIEISEEDVNEYIENLRGYYGERPEVEESEAGDSLIGTFRRGEEFSAQGFFKIEEVPESEQAQFIGLKKEDSLSFDLRTVFPEDEQVEKAIRNAENAKELTGKFTFEVHNISRTIPSEMNLVFFNKVFGEGQVENEEEFVAKVREVTDKYYSTHAKNLLMADFQKGLADQVNPEFPDEFLRKWLLTNGEVNEENIDENFRGFKKNILWEIVRSQATRKHEIPETSQEDLVAHLKNQFFMQYYEMNILSMNDQILDMLVQQYFQNQENQAQIFAEMNTIATTRLIDKIEESLKIETVKMTRQEFEDFSKAQWEKMQAEQEAEKIVNQADEVEEAEVLEA